MISTPDFSEMSASLVTMATGSLVKAEKERAVAIMMASCNSKPAGNSGKSATSKGANSIFRIRVPDFAGDDRRNNQPACQVGHRPTGLGRQSAVIFQKP